MTTRYEEIVRKGDKIRIEITMPIDEVLGLSIYEGVHMKSNQKVLVTTSELTK